MKYIAMIESCYPSLSKSERKVADYILTERGNIIYETLLEISKKINVGEATILRFVKKVGFSGFQDLKLQIAKDDEPVNESYHENYIDSIASNMTNTIINTKKVLDVEQLNIGIDLIEKSNKLFFYGVGASGLAANEAQSRFVRMGKTGIAITDNHFQMMYSYLCGEGDVIIALSLSGYTKDIIDSLKIAKKQNAKIISITNYALSPVAQLADCLLLTAGKENLLDGGSLISKISQLYIIDLLCTGYALLNKEYVLNLKGKTAELLIDKSVT
ncbi:MurR/RpiR family transcriptional regulator [Clostridium sp.]|uniref:MurR/RpiR family transcriptional regulator n=1 Tax=Clostridium sp. TaxID=1506 RepID=UPI002620E053|nr:MurR/RpiR family transcriptional regulator [Clostridium sp.]